jgi:hypothetical protein
MMLFIKLLLAHLIGDFFIQPDSWIKAKEKNKIRSYQLYLHAFLHGCLMMLFVFDWSYLKWAALLAFIHLVIDALKLTFQSEKNKQFYFFADQLAHLVSIYLVFCWSMGYTVFDPSVITASKLVLTTVVVFLTIPCSVGIKIFVSKWTPHTGDQRDDSLRDAGKYIGILERLFVFTFVISGNWEAVGLLLAAKSVFRFGDLKEPRDRKLTEYILIGTLTSFGIAILSGLAVAANFFQ